jgi:hypothetical protein
MFPSAYDVGLASRRSRFEMQVTAHALDDPTNRQQITVRSTHNKLSEDDIARLREEVRCCHARVQDYNHRGHLRTIRLR